MTDEIEVKVLKPFLNGGSMVDNGDKIKAGEMRVRDLERNGLVERAGGNKAPAEKMAKAPENKMATEPANKAAPKSAKKKAK
ncbi:MAG: hypothetical protein ABIN44_03825 [Burkholderiaceae bacterium]